MLKLKWEYNLNLIDIGEANPSQSRGIVYHFNYNDIDKNYG